MDGLQSHPSQHTSCFAPAHSAANLASLSAITRTPFAKAVCETCQVLLVCDCHSMVSYFQLKAMDGDNCTHAVADAIMACHQYRALNWHSVDNEPHCCIWHLMCGNCHQSHGVNLQAVCPGTERPYCCPAGACEVAVSREHQFVQHSSKQDQTHRAAATQQTPGKHQQHLSLWQEQSLPRSYQQ